MAPITESDAAIHASGSSGQKAIEHLLRMTSMKPIELAVTDRPAFYDRGWFIALLLIYTYVLDDIRCDARLPPARVGQGSRGVMSYVLVFWWSFHNTPLAMHSNPDVKSYTLDDCKEAGRKWLSEGQVTDIQTRHAFTCEVGETAYILAGAAQSK